MTRTKAESPGGRPATFDWANEQLYRMCREHPRHTDPSVAMGKVWLIGRAYSASIERKAGKQPRFYQNRVGPMMADSSIDRWLAELADIRRIEPENVDRVLVCHKRLTDLFKTIAHSEKRSLASKYLHFHAPELFFIYDSLANNAIRTRLRGKQFRLPKTNRYDRAYQEFVHRCLELRTRIEAETKKPLSPRELDRLLLDY